MAMGKQRSALLALILLSGAACGSHLDRAKLVRLNSLGIEGRTALVPDGDGPVAETPRETAAPAATGVSAPAAQPTSVAPAGRSPGAGTAGAASAAAPKVSEPASEVTSRSTNLPPAATAPGPIPGRGSGGSAGADAGQPEIVLGSFGTGSGPIGANVADSPAATRAWVADVNTRGGLGGHPVRVVFGDDGGEPDRALALVRRMVEEDKVVGFLNLYTPTTLDAVVPYLEQKNVPVLGTECGSSAPDFSRVIFVPQISCHYGTAWSFYGTVLSQSKARKMALLYCREAAICTKQSQQMKQFESRTDVRIVYEAQISLVQPDFTAEMIAARNAGADVVTLITDSATMIRTIRSAKRQGYNPLFSGTWSFNVDSFAKQGGADVEGVLSVSSTVPYTTSPKAKPYLDAIARYQPGAPKGNFGMTAFSTGLLLERIAARFGSTVTTADFFAGLFSLQGETAGGLFPPITFVRDPPTNRNLCMVPLRMANGRFVPLDGDRFVCPAEYAR
jgi:branched-chain amino acid transport system substrate-binding protein